MFFTIYNINKYYVKYNIIKVYISNEDLQIMNNLWGSMGQRDISVGKILAFPTMTGSIPATIYDSLSRPGSDSYAQSQEYPWSTADMVPKSTNKNSSSSRNML